MALFSDLGAMCAACKKQDYLPFTCESCKKEFCKEHRFLHKPCADDRNGSNPNSPTTMSPRETDPCPVPGCREKLTISGSLVCSGCRRRYCLKHRFPDLHKCPGDKQNQAKAVSRPRGKKKKDETGCCIS
jgi:predicted nucleic acid binding AN1-type Zn finger protein